MSLKIGTVYEHQQTDIERVSIEREGSTNDFERAVKPLPYIKCPRCISQRTFETKLSSAVSITSF